MTDGVIGRENITVPDLIDPIVGFREMIYKPPVRIVSWQEPNFLKLDHATGLLVPDVEKREQAYKRAMAEQNLLKKKVLIEWKPVLISPSYKFTWSRENTAECHRSDTKPHTVPGHDCSCGLYCYYSPKLSVNWRSVLAIVTVSGKIEAHVTGMRAEHMVIEHLFLPETCAQEEETIADDLGVPASWNHFDQNKIMAMALEYGSPLPDSMKPKGQHDLPF